MAESHSWIPSGAILPVFDVIYRSPHFDFILVNEQETGLVLMWQVFSKLVRQEEEITRLGTFKQLWNLQFQLPRREIGINRNKSIRTQSRPS
jgi:hypothetical protein